MSPLSLDCRPFATGVAISVTGELDSTNAGHLETYLGGNLPPGRPVVLDLGGLTFMDSSGLHLVIRVHADVRRQGGSLHLAAVQDLPARLLQVTGVWDVLDIHPSTEAAVATLLRPPAAPSSLQTPLSG